MFLQAFHGWLGRPPKMSRMDPRLQKVAKTFPLSACGTGPVFNEAASDDDAPAAERRSAPLFCGAACVGGAQTW